MKIPTENNENNLEKAFKKGKFNFFRKISKLSLN